MPRRTPFSEGQLRDAVSHASCWADTLRLLGYEVKGHNIRTVQKWARRWEVPTDHFDPSIARARANRARAKPLSEVMIENSPYPRDKLKKRLLATGVKQPVCEMCGQGEIWNGRKMSLVLDHINGVANDHRLENLRIVCANCAATLDTHCGRNVPRVRTCPSCGNQFTPAHIRHRYCSLKCWGGEAGKRYTGVPHPDARKVERPTYEQLLADLDQSNFSAVGRKYGVSDNAIRKWLLWYERQHEREQSEEDRAA